MNFWKEHALLRILLILLFFVTGLILVIGGWKMTGMLSGLGILIIGVVFLLAALAIYNQAFKDFKQ